jgi:hypothetical protein
MSNDEAMSAHVPADDKRSEACVCLCERSCEKSCGWCFGSSLEHTFGHADPRVLDDERVRDLVGLHTNLTDEGPREASDRSVDEQVAVRLAGVGGGKNRVREPTVSGRCGAVLVMFP